MSSFFDKVKSKLNEGASVVSVKSKNLIEITKINTQISTLESNKKAAYEELGKDVYMMVGNGNMDMDAIGKKCVEITTLQNSIEEKREQIKQIQIEEQDTLGKLKLPTCKCGEPLPEGATLCSNCSSKAQPSEPAPVVIAPDEKTKLCECGATLRESAKFCGSCGKLQSDL